jgi:hypothetical protein
MDKQELYNLKRKQNRILFWQDYDEAVRRLESKVKDVKIKNLKNEYITLSFDKQRHSAKVIAQVMALKYQTVFARLKQGRPKK